MRMDHKIRLLTLAHLKNGKTPSEVSELIDVSYAQAMMLNKHLAEAEAADTEEELFDMSEQAIDILVKSVGENTLPALEVFNIGEALAEATQTLITKEDGLDSKTNDAAVAIANKITQAAVLATNPDTLVTLTEALCKLQLTFFGSSDSGSGATGPGSFESFLRD